MKKNIGLLVSIMILGSLTACGSKESNTPIPTNTGVVSTEQTSEIETTSEAETITEVETTTEAEMTATKVTPSRNCFTSTTQETTAEVNASGIPAEIEEALIAFRGRKADDTHFELIYLDDDEIPELMIYHVYSNGYSLNKYVDGELIYLTPSTSSIMNIVERAGYVKTIDGYGEYTDWYRLSEDGKSLIKIANLSPTECSIYDEASGQLVPVDMATYQQYVDALGSASEGAMERLPEEYYEILNAN